MISEILLGLAVVAIAVNQYLEAKRCSSNFAIIRYVLEHLNQASYVMSEELKKLDDKSEK